MLQEIGDDQEQAARHARGQRLADLLEGDPAVDPLGRHLRRRPGQRSRARRVRRGGGRLGQDLGPDRDPPAASSRTSTTNFNVAGAYAAAILLAILAIVDPALDEPASPPLNRGDDDEEPGLQVVAQPPRRPDHARPSKDFAAVAEKASGGIAVKNVTKRFGDFVALDDVSIEVPDGGLTALLGPQRLGQVDPAAGDRRARGARRGRGLISGENTTDGPRPGPRTSASCSSTTPRSST